MCDLWPHQRDMGCLLPLSQLLHQRHELKGKVSPSLRAPEHPE